jgi:hypothetical protein
VESSLLEGAIVGEELFHSTSLGPAVPLTIRSLADLQPETLACMHGPSFRGDGASALRSLAAGYDALFEEACRTAPLAPGA